MRLFLLPITSRNTLIYAQRLNHQLVSKQSTLEKLSTKANDRWAQWEAKESGWQKKVTVWGNQLFAKLPYQEWGLKSIPPLSARKAEAELDGNEKVEVLFPGRTLPESKVPEILKTLATDRQGFHRQRLIWTLIGMPFTIPFALVPVIPNLPFFYMAFRAWSHWKALAGAKHVSYLMDSKLVQFSQSSILQKIYDLKKVSDASIEASVRGKVGTERMKAFISAIEAQSTTAQKQDQPDPEGLLATKNTGHMISLCFDVPKIETELERAIKQIETQIAVQNPTSTSTSISLSSNTDRKV